MATIAALLRQAEQALKQNQAQADDAALDARLLLGYVLQKSSTWLATWPENETDAAAATRFQALVEQRHTGTPTAYLLGEWGFMDFMLKVGPGVLVPRPDTELIVELAADRIPHNANNAGSSANWSVLDLGTGSGAIAIALARLRPQASVHAIERSQNALDIAQDNIDNLAPNVQLHWGSWFEPLAAQQQFEIIVSNPPYIAANEPELAELGQEPQEALVADQDGLADIDHIVENARGHLKTDGWLLIEHGYGQAAATQKLMLDAGYKDIETASDLGGNPRVTLGRWVH